MDISDWSTNEWIEQLRLAAISSGFSIAQIMLENYWISVSFKDILEEKKLTLRCKITW